MKKFICFLGAFAGLLAACSTTTSQQQVTEAPVMSAYYSDWDRAVRADVDMQNMYIGTPSKITRPIEIQLYQTPCHISGEFGQREHFPGDASDYGRKLRL